MFGMGWGEIMIVGIVALIVIGPKDFPKLFYQFGQFAGKMRDMSRQFSTAMNNAARESGVNDMQNTIQNIADPKSFVVKEGEALFDDFDVPDMPESKSEASQDRQGRASLKADDATTSSAQKGSHDDT